MNILCVDPAITNAGLTVFSPSGDILFSETIKFDKKLSQEFRMWQIHEHLASAASKFPIEVIVSERQFVNIMAEMVGVIKAFSGSIKVKSVLFMPPSKWKKLATGKGNIPEDELAGLVRGIWPGLVDASEHELDCAGLFLAWQKEVANPTPKPKRKSKKKSAPKPGA